PLARPCLRMRGLGARSRPRPLRGRDGSPFSSSEVALAVATLDRFVLDPLCAVGAALHGSSSSLGRPPSVVRLSGATKQRHRRSNGPPPPPAVRCRPSPARSPCRRRA